MRDSLYGAPVIPGPGGARRPRPGEPGYLERLIDSHSAYWPMAERAETVWAPKIRRRWQIRLR